MAQERQLEVDVLLDFVHQPVRMDPTIRSSIASIAERMAIPYEVLPSGAGHDSLLFAQHVPTAMTFVPSRDGISHTPVEYTSAADLAAGTQVLAGTLHELAYTVSGHEASGSVR